MCNNYATPQSAMLRDVYGVAPPSDDYPREIWPNYLAPIIRTNDDGKRVAVLHAFSMRPKSAPGEKSYPTQNARTETIGELVTFAGPWRRSQTCLVPAQFFYEPNYEATPKKSVRYRIGVKNEPNFAIAGVWNETASGFRGFTMPTINADGHGVMGRMHAPGKEKRSIVILAPDQWDDWLICRDPELARSFLTLYPADAMYAEPAPLPGRPAKSTVS